MQAEIEKTLKWASELSEAWVGTTTGKIIDVKKEHIESMGFSGDILSSVQELKKICEHAQKELDE